MRHASVCNALLLFYYKVVVLFFSGGGAVAQFLLAGRMANTEPQWRRRVVAAGRI